MMIEGHSGCKISFQNGTVIKGSSPEYAPRLHKQCEKQILFSSLDIHAQIKIPQVMHFGHGSFEMEYCGGLDCFEFLGISGRMDLQILLNIVIKFLQYCLHHSQVVQVNCNIFTKKFDTIKAKLQDKQIDTSTLEEQFIKLLQPPIMLPIGYCHGDLTLSNIIFDQETHTIVLVDFLDSFIETPLQDIAKLRQDTIHNWSAVLYDEQYDTRRISSSLQFLDNGICEVFQKESWWKHYALLQFINLLRILPYTKSEKTTQHILRELKCIP